MDKQQADAMQQKLGQLGLGAESIHVFGAIRTNVHVICVSRETAEKWALALAQIFKVKPYVGRHFWNAAVNKGTCLKPTMRKGFLITIAEGFPSAQGVQQ